MSIDIERIAASAYVIALCFLLIFLSYRYLLSVFISELESTPKVVKSAFAVTSGVSFLVFFLIWAEFGQWVPSIRALAWQISMSSLLTLMVVIVPTMLDFAYFSEGGGFTNRYRYCCTLLAIMSQLYMFFRIGDLLPATSTQSFLAACVLRVSYLGISAMALVSGFGAVSALWNVFSTKRIVSEFELSRIRQSIETSTDQVEAKTRLLNKLEKREAENTSLFSRLLGAASTQELETAQQDLSDMQDLHNSLLADLTSSQAAFDDQLRSKTFAGLAFTVFDFVFSMYCVYRIGTTIWNLSPYGSRSSSDPISQFLALLAVHYDTADIDRDAWANTISFMLSGVVIIGSLRACLVVLARMSRVLPHLINQQSMALVFAILIGLYNVATAVVLCRNLPSEYGRNILTNLGATLDQSKFDVWFDSVFLFGVCFTALILFVQRKISGLELDDLVLQSEKSV